MKKNIVILGNSVLLLLLLVVFGCKKPNCYDCEFYYYSGEYVNATTHDTVALYLSSNTYGLDTLLKYYKLGYLRSGNGASEHLIDNLCDEELDSLNKNGINYNCKFSR